MFKFNVSKKLIKSKNNYDSKDLESINTFTNYKITKHQIYEIITINYIDWHTTELGTGSVINQNAAASSRRICNFNAWRIYTLMHRHIRTAIEHSIIFALLAKRQIICSPRNVHGIEIDKLFMKDPQISSLSIVSRVERNYVRRKKRIVNG